MSRSATVIASALAVAATLPIVPAQAAARDRVFVASYGDDSNPCTFLSPCKTFQQAVDVVAVNGEVTAIDSAGFGPINITKAVTITSPPGVEAGIQAAPGGYAIGIVAPGANVSLRGLTLEGAGVAYNGIVFDAGDSLTVTDCVVQNFINDNTITTGNGILIEPTSGAISFVITNTIVSNNGFVGINYIPQSGSATATGVIDRVVATNNITGIAINTGFGGGPMTVAISNSIASNNSNSGIFFQNGSAALTVSIDNTSVSGNAVNGIAALNTTQVLLGRSAITGNGVGINNQTNPTNTFYSYQNNAINANNPDFNVSPNTSFALR